MNLHRLLSYTFITAGAVTSVRNILQRYQWEEHNVLAGIVLDWDDVQAVATRAPGLGAEGDDPVEALLRRYQAAGATHLSIPELSLARLLACGNLSVDQGAEAGTVYLRAKDAALADLIVTELQARLPQLQVKCSRAKHPLISFKGDLPTVAEIGLGFNPAHAALAHRVDLAPVARPIGYSWVQPEMIERTLAQAADLKAKIVAVQGRMTPGFEFNLHHTVEALRRHRLTYAYFAVSRHQRGDWHLAKNLAEDGLVMLAHEFQPAELLDEDWGTLSDRWANLATEAGIRLCCVRFFRVIHAADPLESITYVESLARALRRVELVISSAAAVDLTPFQPERDRLALAGAGLGAAGAAGLAADLLPVPEPLKLTGLAAGALALSALPFWEKSRPDGHDHHHHHHHDSAEAHAEHHHDHAHPHPPDHHQHEHSHDHAHDRIWATTYGPKGVALAAAIAYPAAVAALNGAGPGTALAQSLLLSTAGATSLGATAAEADYVHGVEAYRGYNLDWLLPLGLAAITALTSRQPGLSRWLPLASFSLAAWPGLRHGLTHDALARLDQEHRHAHTHHLSTFQRVVGDSQLVFSLRPLRKWSLLVPLGAVGAVLFKQQGQPELAGLASLAATAGQVATLAGFRNSQRPLKVTALGRAKGWAVGTVLAGLVWAVSRWLGTHN